MRDNTAEQVILHAKSGTPFGMDREPLSLYILQNLYTGRVSQVRGNIDTWVSSNY